MCPDAATICVAARGHLLGAFANANERALEARHERVERVCHVRNLVAAGDRDTLRKIVFALGFGERRLHFSNGLQDRALRAPGERAHGERREQERSDHPVFEGGGATLGQLTLLDQTALLDRGELVEYVGDLRVQIVILGLHQELVRLRPVVLAKGRNRLGHDRFEQAPDVFARPIGEGAFL